MIETAIEVAEEGEVIVFPETALIFSQNEIKDWIAYIDYKAEQKNITLITGIIPEVIPTLPIFSPIDRKLPQ